MGSSLGFLVVGFFLLLLGFWRLFLFVFLNSVQLMTEGASFYFDVIFGLSSQNTQCLRGQCSGLIFGELSYSCFLLFLSLLQDLSGK